MPVINIGGTNYTVNNFDDDTNDSTLFDDYLVGTESTLNDLTALETITGNETFVGLDLDEDTTIDLYGKLGTNEDGEKYVDLRDDKTFNLRSLDLVTSDMSVEAALNVIKNSLGSLAIINKEAAGKITLALGAVFKNAGLDQTTINLIVNSMSNGNTEALSGAVETAIADISASGNE